MNSSVLSNNNLNSEVILRKKLILIVTAVFMIFSIAWNNALANENLLKRAGFSPVKQTVIAPRIRLYDLDGNLVKLEDYKGKVVLLFFWATW